MTLDPARYPNEAARNAVLEDKSARVRAMHLDKREGVVSIPVRDALARYLAEHRRSLRERTLADYERFGEVFADWCDANEITFTRELTKGRLEQFRTERVTLPSSRDDDELRSPATVNVELRSVHVLIVAWSRKDWTPQLTRDAISDALRPSRVTSEEIEFLSPRRCQLLLQAALAHDRLRFRETREEHAGNGEPGSTQRYTSIVPFVAVVLLSGMRRGEALALTWRDVDTSEKLISLRGSATKTKRARRFDMTFSPLLLEILRSLWQNTAKDGFPANGTERVFPELTVDTIESTRRRMLERETATGFPSLLGQWSWQALRRTCATALANMPNAGPWVESKALGHSVTVAERLYADRMRVDPSATTIERALQIEREAGEIFEATTQLNLSRG